MPIKTSHFLHGSKNLRSTKPRSFSTPPPPPPILQSIHPDFLIPVISMSELLPFGYHEDRDENQNVSKELYAI